MAAIVTDQFRVLNAENFISQFKNSSLYAFVGLTNSTDYNANWESNPPGPIDSFDNFNDVWDTIVALKKINFSDITRVIPRKQWESGITYDMYRHDISRNTASQPFYTNKTSLYESNYYVMNSDFRVYICLQNGTSPENKFGNPSIDEPKFTDLEPREAGTSGDGYIWKYLYTISPGDAIKFDSLFYIPVPDDWGSDVETALIKDNANSSISGQLKTIIIKNRGLGLGSPGTKENIPIIGDGDGALATIVIGNDGTVEDIIITNGGSGYTYGVVDYASAGINGDPNPEFDVIIPPPGGHGFDIYKELGAKNVLMYSRIENDNLDPDFVTGTKVARIGLIKNPVSFESTELASKQKVSNVYALKLIGVNPNDVENATFAANSIIKQTQNDTGIAYTAVGRVINYDKNTGVLKYWKDRSNSGFTTGTYSLNDPQVYGQNWEFISSSDIIVGETSSLGIDTGFTGITTEINSQTYNLGQEFTNGLSNPEVKKYSGEMIYIDNRPSITRSINQKEDIKIILQF